MRFHLYERGALSEASSRPIIELKNTVAGSLRTGFEPENHGDSWALTNKVGWRGTNTSESGLSEDGNWELTEIIIARVKPNSKLIKENHAWIENSMIGSCPSQSYFPRIFIFSAYRIDCNSSRNPQIVVFEGTYAYSPEFYAWLNYYRINEIDLSFGSSSWSSYEFTLNWTGRRRTSLFRQKKQ